MLWDRDRRDNAGRRRKVVACLVVFSVADVDGDGAKEEGREERNSSEKDSDGYDAFM